VEIFAFLLIGGIWAAFLLPAFFESRRHTPTSTTRSFARSQDLLASISGVNSSAIKARLNSARRRQRVFALLATGAFASLVIAVLQNSFLWLAVTFLFDIGFAGYVTLVLHLNSNPLQNAPVLPLVVPESPEDSQYHTVRVIAG